MASSSLIVIWRRLALSGGRGTDTDHYDDDFLAPKKHSPPLTCLAAVALGLRQRHAKRGLLRGVICHRGPVLTLRGSVY